MSEMTYSEFLQNKICLNNVFGFEVDPSRINAQLKPHQRDSVVWALQGGRRALFESFGLGKPVNPDTLEIDCPLEKERVLEGFAEKLLENQEPLPPEYAEVVSKHFWELLDDTEPVKK